MLLRNPVSRRKEMFVLWPNVVTLIAFALVGGMIGFIIYGIIIGFENTFPND
jgi:hypothetical protein